MKKTPLTSVEQKLLKSCYDLMRDLESSQGAFIADEITLSKISALLSSFAISDSLELQRLSTIPQHFHRQMSLQHFANFILPLERLLNKSLSDDDFLITDSDRIKIAADKSSLYFVLDNLRSSFNVGSIFRLADCLNITSIYLCGYTPTPTHHGVEKTSLGSISSLHWQHFTNIELALENLKSNNIPVFALETAQNSKSIFDCKLPSSCAFVVGNERFGLNISQLQMCQEVISIPTFGIKNSLNVSNALSIAGYEWKRQQSL